jgi:hypothetical protein
MKIHTVRIDLEKTVFNLDGLGDQMKWLCARSSLQIAFRFLNELAPANLD